MNAVERLIEQIKAGQDELYIKSNEIEDFAKYIRNTTLKLQPDTDILWIIDSIYDGEFTFMGRPLRVRG